MTSAITKAQGVWPRVAGNRRCCWDTPWGQAYGMRCPPVEAPLTLEAVRALPDGVRILVLWSGGNGPHEYIWCNGRVFVPGHQSSCSLGGIPGVESLVGSHQWQDKVWLADSAEAS